MIVEREWVGKNVEHGLLDCVMDILGLRANNKTIRRNSVRRQSLIQVGLARDDEIDFEKLVVVLFGFQIMSDRARTRRRLIAVITAAATAGRATAIAMDRGRIFLHWNRKLVTIWAHNLLVPTVTTMKELQRSSMQYNVGWQYSKYLHSSEGEYHILPIFLYVLHFHSLTTMYQTQHDITNYISFTHKNLYFSLHTKSQAYLSRSTRDRLAHLYPATPTAEVRFAYQEP